MSITVSYLGQARTYTPFCYNVRQNDGEVNEEGMYVFSTISQTLKGTTTRERKIGVKRFHFLLLLLKIYFLIYVVSSIGRMFISIYVSADTTSQGIAPMRTDTILLASPMDVLNSLMVETI